MRTRTVFLLGAASLLGLAVPNARAAATVDFFSENLFPWKVRDVRRFHYKLEPRRMVNTTELLKQADNLRNRGISIRPPENNPPPNPPPVIPTGGQVPTPMSP